MIVAASVAALIVIGSVSGAIAAGNRGANSTLAGDSAPVASPSPSLTQAVPSPASTPEGGATPTAAAVDPTYFKANAAKQLDDYAKDLGDLSDAVAKGSTLRVMSNSIELAFNEGQMAGITPAANVAAEWSTALAGLSTTTTQIADAISKEDYTTVNSLINQANLQIGSLRDIADRAA